MKRVMKSFGTAFIAIAIIALIASSCGSSRKAGKSTNDTPGDRDMPVPVAMVEE